MQTSLENQRILMIGDTWQYIKFHLVEKFNMKVTLFQSPDRKHLIREEYCEDVHIIDLNNFDEIIKQAKTLHQTRSFKAVWSFADVGTEPASIVAQKLGLKHNSVNATRIVNNKATLRDILNKKGLGPVNYTVTKSVKTALNFCEFNYPFIVKPLVGSGSQKIFKVNNDKELVDAVKKVTDNEKNEIIIEEYLKGREISVEGMSYSGSHSILQLTDKITNPKNHVEMAHIMPAQLTDEMKGQVYKLVDKTLNAIGHTFGPTHIEIKLTKTGPKIIEAHTRPGGDFITELLDFVYNIDVIKLTMENLITGKERKIPIPSTSKGGAVKFFDFPPGTISRIGGTEKVKRNSNLIILDFNLKVGQQIKKTVDSYSRHGCLVVSGTTAENAYETAEEMFKSINIEME
ncbi:ATP-grasp domain-containing protein [Virgibacillus alimentarius]|uniref:ATP-grasp domain-containing protein n=1 Tax=Virgibacillus alimentarius TaxID=698769 RepID=UPI0004930A23|nr:ATP-grasp domain-containing protein [Virgibacillus alimentarius]